jgi:DNA replication protein DnaC
MHSSSDRPEPPIQSWIAERRDAAVAAFTAKIPGIYQAGIELEAPVASWAAGRSDCPSLFLTGPIGVGKTHSAWQASRQWVHHRFGGTYRGSPVVEIYRSTALFDALRPDAHDNSGRSLVKHLQKVDLLFIDDLAAARPSSWTQERLFEIFDERYINRRPVLITCDVLPSALADVTGDRVRSRLAEMCRGGVVLLQGVDRRRGAAA